MVDKLVRCKDCACMFKDDDFKDKDGNQDRGICLLRGKIEYFTGFCGFGSTDGKVLNSQIIDELESNQMEVDDGR